MKDDPRERVETENLLCHADTSCWYLTRKAPYAGAGRADWPEFVELAQKILAADAAWKEQTTPRRFPVLNANSRNSKNYPRTVPWSMLAPHEPQALKNHCGQSLEKLASRGGLSPLEIYAVVNGLTWTIGKLPCDEEEALRWLAATLAEITPVEGREELTR